LNQILPQKSTQVTKPKLDTLGLLYLFRSTKLPHRKTFLAQRRKGAKRYRVSKDFLCVFAPLREKGFPHRCSQMHFCGMLALMDLNELARLLDAYKRGELETSEALDRIKNLHFEDIGFARVDHSRASRQGFPEVVFGGGKTRAQVVGIVDRLAQRSPNIIVTRTDEGTFGEIRNVVTDAEWHESARLVRIRRDKTNQGVGSIAVVTAGTSDIPVAEEAALTAETMGNTVDRIWDAGVAGIHRVLSERSLLQRSRVVIVAAGMEGALPSVVGGLVAVPVVAVPTSIGYGASFGGVAALLGMLNSCASNVTVVNIDNGFGAGFVASLINRRWTVPVE